MCERLLVGAVTAIAPARFSPGRFLHALRIRPPTSEATKRIKKIKNKILAIPAEAAAIPANPKTAAINATMRKITVQRNMDDLLAPNSIPTIQGRVHRALRRWIQQSTLWSILDR
jgi:hypothetical protein